MKRLSIAPTVSDLKREVPFANNWFTVVGERFNVYQGPSDPVAGDLAEGQWILYRNTTTGKLNTWALIGGVVYSVATISAGTVTDVSVATANGFAGTVATSTTTPVITLRTTITGLLKGNGTAISAAAAGTDYVAPTTTVNGHPLSANVTVTAADVGAPSGSGTSTGANTGDQTITLTGDVTGTGNGSFATTIGANKVTYSKFVAATAASLLVGRGSAAGAGNFQEIILGTGLSMSGTTLNVTAGGTGTVTSISIASLNGFGASIVNPTTTPAITLGTSVTGIMMGNGSAALAATAGTDYVAPGGALGTPSSGTLTNCTGLPITGGISGMATGADTFLSTAVGFETMLARVTLGVAGTTLASGTFAARKNLRVEIFISGYAGSDTASLQFNATGGVAYRYRWITCAPAAVVFTAGLLAVSTDRIKVAAVNTTLSRRVVAWISNDSTVTEKLVTFSEVTGTGSAATQGTIDIGHGAWVSGAATQITAISLLSTSNLNVGTQMTIFGWN